MLQNPCINFSINDREVNPADFAYQHAGLSIQLGGFDKIGAYPVFKVFRFTDVDELVVGIPVLVYPRPVRYLLKCFAKVEFGHCYLFFFHGKAAKRSRKGRKVSILYRSEEHTSELQSL